MQNNTRACGLEPCLPHTMCAAVLTVLLGREVSCEGPGSTQGAMTQGRQRGSLTEGFLSETVRTKGVGQDKEVVQGSREAGAQLGMVGSTKEALGSGFRSTGLTNRGWPPEQCLGPCLPRCPKVPSPSRILGPLDHGATLLWPFFYFCIPRVLTMR